MGFYTFGAIPDDDYSVPSATMKSNASAIMVGAPWKEIDLDKLIVS
jgi:hypothetical protein